MRIVVTGALGHIGSRLIRELPETFPGAEILLVDNLSTQRYCSLFNLPQVGRYRFVEADILTADLPSLLRGADVTIHLAAITDASSSFQIPEQVERVNHEGVERIASACLLTGSALVFASTTSVYGSQAEVVDETCADADIKPQSPYAESKLRAEKRLQELSRSGGLRLVIFRFGTIFGPSAGMRFHTAVNKFCWQAVFGQPITVWRTAMDQYRPYLDLEDAVGVTTFAIKKQLFQGQLFNVVTTNETVAGVLAVISEFCPNLIVQHVDTPIMNQLSYHVRSDLIRDAGFRFRGDLRRSIGESISWLKQSRTC